MHVACACLPHNSLLVGTICESGPIVEIGEGWLNASVLQKTQYDHTSYEPLQVHCMFANRVRHFFRAIETPSISFIHPVSSSPAVSHTVSRTMASAMGKRLEGKTVVITGASSGIGRSTAFEFARTSPKNLKLVLTARRLDTLKQVAADITKEVGEGVKVLPVQLDVSNPDEIKQFVQNLPAEFKEIDVLVNNAYDFFSQPTTAD